jgi:hypothetical protein
MTTVMGSKLTFTRAPTHSIILVCRSRQQLMIGPEHVPAWMCEHNVIVQIDFTEAHPCHCPRDITDADMFKFIQSIQAAGGQVRLDVER